MGPSRQLDGTPFYVMDLGSESFIIFSMDRMLEILQKRLRYDPDTGVFTCLITSNPKYQFVRSGGYLCMEFEDRGRKRRVLSHRAAWAMTFGYWPKILDHKDGDPKNNRLSNLREATHTQNCHNSGKRGSNTTSKYKGVDFCKSRSGTKRYKVRVGANGKRYTIGWFRTEEEAAKAAKEAYNKYHGEYSIYNSRLAG